MARIAEGKRKCVRRGEEVGEEDGAEERSGGATDAEREGERRGRKAFLGVRYLLEGVRLQNDTDFL